MKHRPSQYEIRLYLRGVGVDEAEKLLTAVARTAGPALDAGQLLRIKPERRASPFPTFDKL